MRLNAQPIIWHIFLKILNLECKAIFQRKKINKDKTSYKFVYLKSHNSKADYKDIPNWVYFEVDRACFESSCCVWPSTCILLSDVSYSYNLLLSMFWQQVWLIHGLHGNHYSRGRRSSQLCGGHCSPDRKSSSIPPTADCLPLSALRRHALYVYRVEGRLCTRGVRAPTHVLVLFCIPEFILDICTIDIDNTSLCSSIGESIWRFTQN